MRYTSLLLSTFLFVILFSSYAYAYIAPLSNTSDTFNQFTIPTGLSCINATTGDVYCYLLTTDSNAGVTALRRYNSTWQNASVCTLPVTNANGLTVINETFAVLPNSTYSCDLYDITNIDSNNCTLVSSQTSASCMVGSGDENNGAWNGTHIYAPSSGQYLNETLQNDGLNPFYDGVNNSLSIPDKTDVTTFWIYKGYNGGDSGTNTHSGFTKWVSGSATNSTGKPKDIWDIGYTVGCPYDFVYFSLVKVEGELLGYAIDINTVPCDGLETDFFYIVNMTDFDAGYDSSIITAIAPIENNTMLDNPPILNVNIIAGTNGQITWYIDGVSKGATTIIANATTQNVYFTSPTALEIGYHYWEGNFTDSNSVVWSTGVQWFNEGQPDILTDPVNGVAMLFGSFFSVTDLDTAKDMFAIFVSLFSGVIVAIVMSHFSRGQMNIKTMTGFIPIWTLIMLVFFGIGGFLSLGLSLMIGAITLVFVFYMVKSGA